MATTNTSPPVHERRLICAGCKRWVDRAQACQAPDDVGHGRGYCPSCQRFVDVLIALIGRSAGRIDGLALCLAVREIHDLHAHQGHAWPLSATEELEEC